MSEHSPPPALSRTTKVDETGSLKRNRRDQNLSKLISDKFCVWTFGDNSAGQLFVPPVNGKRSIPRPQKVPKLSNKRVSFLACGSATTFVTAETGEVWGGGENDIGQISLGTDNESIEHEAGVSKPCLLEKLCGTSNVRSIAVGAQHLVVVFGNGGALSYGTNEYGQLGQGVHTLDLHPRPPRAVVSMMNQGGVSYAACGRNFTLFLTKWGEVWACGDNSHGCLGVPNLDFSPVPVRVGALTATPVMQIAAGDEHCLALSLAGNLYVWGRCNQGQLGMGEKFANDGDKFIRIPRVVPRELLPGRPKRVATGSAHSIVVVAGGGVVASGLNTSGQCGINSATHPNVWEFTSVAGLNPDLRWLMAAAGTSHTLLLSASGTAFSFGRNLEGQLGTGAFSPFECSPQRVDVPNDSSSGFMFIYGCSAGGYHSALAAVPINMSAASVKELTRQASVEGQWVQKESTNTIPVLPLFRVESDIRPSKSIKCLAETKSIADVLSQRSRSTLSSLVSSVQLENKPAAAALDAALVKVGYSSAELIEAFEEAQARGLQDVYKNEIRSVFTNASRMNCSFLLKAKNPDLDVMGLTRFYDHDWTRLQDDKVRAELLAIIVTAIDECMSSVEATAAFLSQADQIHFILISLHCPAFGRTPLPNTIGMCLSKIFRLVSLMPCAGRRHLFTIITNSYPADEFRDRLVNPARQHVAFTLPRHVGKRLPDVRDLWDLMLFLQLCYLVNEEVASQTRLEENTRRLGKLSHEEFAVLFPLGAQVDPGAEYRTLSSFAAAHRMRADAAAVGSRQSQAESIIDQQMATKDVESYLSSSKTPIAPSCPWRYDPRSVLLEEGCVREEHRFFLAHTNLLPLSFKRDVFRTHSTFRQALAQSKALQFATLTGTPPDVFFTLVVSRKNVVQDALRQINYHHGSVLTKPLKVVFQEEEGIDDGGLKREFFRIVTEEILNPSFGMFTYDNESRYSWFSPCPIEGQGIEFALIGLLLSLAIYNDVRLDLKLAPAVYKKVQQVSTNFQDFVDVNRAKANSLSKLLECPVKTEEERAVFEACFGMLNFVETLEFYGTVKSVPLQEGGEDIYITPENRQLYVDLVADFYLNKSISNSFRDFRTGLVSLCDMDLLGTLTPQELQLLLNGPPDLDFNELRLGARYEGGYAASSPYIEGFWNIVQGWDLLKKQRFLLFCTGSARSPIGGLKELRLGIQKNGSEPTERLPTAYTCYNVLLLPEYSSVEKLDRLLSMAIELGEGFGLR